MINNVELTSLLGRSADEKTVVSYLEPAVKAMRDAFATPFKKAMTDTLVAAGTDTARNLVKARKPKHASHRALATDYSIDFVFDKTNTAVFDWIEEHTGELLDDLSKTTVDKIKDIIARAFDEQVDVKVVFDDLVNAIGDEERADLIARTESMMAANEGQAEAWDQAVEAGLLTGNEKKVWIVTDDDALCPICEGLADQVVPLDDNFESEDGEFDVPPAHPRCRCTTGLVEGE